MLVWWCAICFVMGIIFNCGKSCQQDARQEAADEEIENATRTTQKWVSSMNAGDSSQCSSGDIANYDNTVFPSGKWKGYYHRYGRDHQHFMFDLNGTISNGEIELCGHGIDGVGEYSINGRFDEATGRMSFIKQYQKGTGDPFQNFGYSVEYKGIVQNHIEAGVRGSWFMSSDKCTFNGIFHIWPCNPPIRLGVCYNQVTEASPLISTLSPFNANQNQVDSSLLPYYSSKGIEVSTLENECVICFTQNVNTILRPCGHIALCTSCANRLDKCPLCRSFIYSVEQLYSSMNNSHNNSNSHRKIFNLIFEKAKISKQNTDAVN